MGCGCHNQLDQPDNAREQIDGSLAARTEGNPVLGPYLQGGLNGNFSLPMPGGGMIPAVTHVAVLGEPAFRSVRQDFHFDYSTPGQLNERQRPENEALWRSFGGLL